MRERLRQTRAALPSGVKAASGLEAQLREKPHIVRPGHRWVEVPRGYVAEKGCQLCVCPLTGRVQARKRLSPLSLEEYLGEWG